MMDAWIARGVLVGALLLVGCAGGAGGDAPRRPALAVSDEVGAVERSQVVGTWTCRELNPYPEVPRQTSTITYNADGTFTGEGTSEARPPFGAMQMRSTGRWTVDGDRIVTSDVAIKASAEDAFTNVMAGIGSSIAETFGKAQGPGSGEVLKLTRSELVLRPVGVEDPPIFACSR